PWHRGPAPTTCARMQRAAIALTVLIVVLVLVVLVHAPRVFFIILAGFLLSLVLRHPSQGIARHTRLGYGISLALTVLTSVLAILVLSWLLGTRINAQVQGLADQLPKAIADARAWVNGIGWLRALLAPFLGAQGPNVSPEKIFTGAKSVLAGG